MKSTLIHGTEYKSITSQREKLIEKKKTRRKILRNHESIPVLYTKTEPTKSENLPQGSDKLVSFVLGLKRFE